MNVYIVSTGERGEGSCVERVFADIAGAKAYVFELYEVCPAYVRPGVWRCSLNRVDEVWIQRMKVRGAA